MIRRLRTDRSRFDDTGITLVEVIVTTAVLGIVLFVVFGFLINATTITGRADANVRAEQEAINGLRTVTEDLRSANVLSTCTGLTYAECVTVDISQASTSDDECPKRVVVYRVTGTDLTRSLTDYAADCTTVTNTIFQKLIGGVQSTSIFTYYDEDGVTALDLSNAIDLDKVPDTPAIKVAVSVEYRKNVDPLSFSSIASLRNKR